MKFGGHMDYHGSRAYAPEPANDRSRSWLKRFAGPLTAWAEHLLDMLLKTGARETAETVWLVRGEERHFSVLGSQAQRKQRPAAGWLWPEGEARLRRAGYHCDND